MESKKTVVARAPLISDDESDGKMKRFPSCEFLDQIEKDMNLLYTLDDYAKELYEKLAHVEIDEENKQMIVKFQMQLKIEGGCL
jgi:hypothetical protein